MNGAIALAIGGVYAVVIPLAFAWVTILPTLGLLWCFGVLK